MYRQNCDISTFSTFRTGCSSDAQEIQNGIEARDRGGEALEISHTALYTLLNCKLSAILNAIINKNINLHYKNAYTNFLNGF